MRQIALMIVLLAWPLMGNESQSTTAPGLELPTYSNNAFQVGEYLKYRIHYGIINAGIAELRVQQTTTRQNRPVYHMVGTGRSVGMAEWFFKTRDRYETYMDTESLLPWEFVRDVNEGGYTIQRHLIFDHHRNKARDLDLKPVKEFDIKPNAQDMLSTFYYARCLPTENLKPGDVLPIHMFLDHEDFSFKLKYLGTEMMKTQWGRVRCKKLIPVVQEGRVFRDKEGLTLWVTDDENKVPVRLQAELAVGSIKMDLVEYDNLRHSISFQR